IEPAASAALADTPAQVERLGDLVEQLLDLSRLESAAVSLELRQIKALDLLQEVVREWRGTAGARNVSLEFGAFPSDLQVTVDPNRMRQGLGNVVANAIRHSPERGRVVLKARGGNGTPRPRGAAATGPPRRGSGTRDRESRATSSTACSSGSIAPIARARPMRAAPGSASPSRAGSSSFTAGRLRARGGGRPAGG